MESKRSVIKKQAIAGYGSNVHTKAIVPNVPIHAALINSQPQSQYSTRAKAAPSDKNSKPATSRNQAQEEQEKKQHATKTMMGHGKTISSHNNLNEMNAGYQHTRLATEDADDMRNDSLHIVNGARKQLKKNNTVRQLKSPSPRKVKQNILAAQLKQDAIVHANPHTQKTKTSVPKRVRREKVGSVVPPSNMHQLKGSMVSSDGERSIPQQKKLLQHSTKPASKQISSTRYKPTGKEVAEAQKQMRTNQTQHLSVVVGEKDSRYTETVQSPSILQSFGSPRIGGFVGNSTAGTSTLYSAGQGGDSMMSSSIYQVAGGRKLCLSEKIAPKGKKSRKNAQKQPKQISISREQINIQEQPVPQLPQSQHMINYQKYLLPAQQRVEIQLYNQPTNNLKDFFYHQQHIALNPMLERYDRHHARSDSQELQQKIEKRDKERSERQSRIERIERMERESEERKSRLERREKAQNMEATLQDRTQRQERYSMPQPKESVYIDRIAVDHTPIATLEQDEKSLENTPKVKEFTRESFSKNLGPHGEVENSQAIFSFHAYPKPQSSKPSVPSDSEDVREVTGIFGAQMVDTLGNENNVRTSTEGIIDKKKLAAEIPTPVFSAENRRNHSFLKSSESLVKLETTQPDNYVTLNTEKVDKELKQLKSKEPAPVVVQQMNEQQRKQQEFVFKSEIESSKYDSAKTTVLEMDRERTMKKVHSTSDLAFGRKAYTQLNTSNHSSQHSQGSFFNRIRNYFKFGQQNTQNENDNTEVQYDVQYRCNCGYSGKNYVCVRALKWLSFVTNYSEKEYQKNKILYEGLIEMKAPSGSETQIERDIPRTFPNSDPFMNGYEGQQQLQRVLNAFSKYDTSIGYVQGMNFIVGALLQHCSEDIAFWLFVTLIEDYEMRDIYQPRLPGLYKHSQIIELLQIEHLRDLHNHFCLHNILIEMYASDWIFCLFSNIIPLREYHYFLDQFFEGGWMFFYKFALSFMKALAPELIEYNDISEILTIIKLKYTKKDSMMPSLPSVENTYLSSQDNQSSRQRIGDSISPNRNPSSHRPSNNSQIQFQVKNMINRLIWKEERFNSESFKDDSIWEKIVEIANREWEDDFNESFVQNLLQNFDAEKLIFKHSELSTPKQRSSAASPTKMKGIQSQKVVTIQRGPVISKDFIPATEKINVTQNDSKVQVYLSESPTKHRQIHSDMHKVIQMSERQSLPPKFTKNGSVHSTQQVLGKVATAKIYLVGSPTSPPIAEKRGSVKRQHK